ncbi:hypothetical protein HPB47_025124 [Ixodes persulcatus]|uniref:Uncharacterized protein n=1 Tax=Ixodes persulcatus TaxID=34615 RepID=A0AC60Q2B6_IXOPE|nr:hypothetical protein HPB47_025124 [Ixodes persulcatus]
MTRPPSSEATHRTFDVAPSYDRLQGSSGFWLASKTGPDYYYYSPSKTPGVLGFLRVTLRWNSEVVNFEA